MQAAIQYLQAAMSLLKTPTPKMAEGPILQALAVVRGEAPGSQGELPLESAGAQEAKSASLAWKDLSPTEQAKKAEELHRELASIPRVPPMDQERADRFIALAEANGFEIWPYVCACGQRDKNRVLHLAHRRDCPEAKKEEEPAPARSFCPCGKSFTEGEESKRKRHEARCKIAKEKRKEEETLPDPQQNPRRCDQCDQYFYLTSQRWVGERWICAKCQPLTPYEEALLAKSPKADCNGCEETWPRVSLKEVDEGLLCPSCLKDAQPAATATPEPEQIQEKTGEPTQPSELVSSFVGRAWAAKTLDELNDVNHEIMTDAGLSLEERHIALQAVGGRRVQLKQLPLALEPGGVEEPAESTPQPPPDFAVRCGLCGEPIAESIDEHLPKCPKKGEAKAVLEAFVDGQAQKVSAILERMAPTAPLVEEAPPQAPGSELGEHPAITSQPEEAKCYYCGKTKTVTPEWSFFHHGDQLCWVCPPCGEGIRFKTGERAWRHLLAGALGRAGKAKPLSTAKVVKCPGCGALVTEAVITEHACAWATGLRMEYHDSGARKNYKTLIKEGKGKTSSLTPEEEASLARLEEYKAHSHTLADAEARLICDPVWRSWDSGRLAALIGCEESFVEGVRGSPSQWSAYVVCYPDTPGDWPCFYTGGEAQVCQEKRDSSHQLAAHIREHIEGPPAPKKSRPKKAKEAAQGEGGAP